MSKIKIAGFFLKKLRRDQKWVSSEILERNRSWPKKNPKQTKTSFWPISGFSVFRSRSWQKKTIRFDFIETRNKTETFFFFFRIYFQASIFHQTYVCFVWPFIGLIRLLLRLDDDGVNDDDDDDGDNDNDDDDGDNDDGPNDDTCFWRKWC